MSGVLFVELEDGVLVYKFGGQSCPSEYYTSLVAGLLPLRSPKMTVLSQGDLDFV